MLIKLLRAFLRLGVDPSPDPPESPTPPEDAGTGDVEFVDDAPAPPEPGPAPVREAPEVTALRLRLEAIERENALLRQQPAPQSARPSADPEYEREEAILADLRRRAQAGEPQAAEALSWNEWKISGDRERRALRKEVQETRGYTADALDKSSFDRLESSEPRRYKHFAPKVEQAVAEFRRAGQQPPPRMAIYNYLVGEAVRNGSLKPRSAAAPAEPAPSTPPRNRGSLPPARSDVNPKDRSGMTEHQKRIERMKAEFAKGHYL